MKTKTEMLNDLVATGQPLGEDVLSLSDILAMPDDMVMVPRVPNMTVADREYVVGKSFVERDTPPSPPSTRTDMKTRTELLDDWISVTDRLPKCDMKSNSFGVTVLVWPHTSGDNESSMPVAFFGCRQTDKPSFYIFGRVIDVTHWKELPAGPKP